MKKRVKFDRSRPDTREIVDSIVHGAATTEGTMVAFPTCFPGVTAMLPPDESRIRAMDVAEGGIVYAGTSGRQCHLLVGMFHGITGIVFDMGVVEGVTECAAMCCGRKRFLAAVNGPSGGRLVARDLQPLPFDLIQEWHISRSPYQYLDGLQPGERCVHAVADSTRATAIVATDRRLLTVNLDSLEVRAVADLACTPRLALNSGGNVYGRDEGDTLWRLAVKSGKLTRKAVRLPSRGAWDLPVLKWARDWSSGVLYTVDARGRIFAFSEKAGFGRALATVPVQPTGAMAVTTDGRLYVSAGDGIGRVYCLEPGARTVKDLGVAVSVIQRRRYGCQFGDAVVGRDGEIVFGEDDDGAHVWLYFPRIMRPAGGRNRGRTH